MGLKARSKHPVGTGLPKWPDDAPEWLFEFIEGDLDLDPEELDERLLEIVGPYEANDRTIVSPPLMLAAERTKIERRLRQLVTETARDHEVTREAAIQSLMDLLRDMDPEPKAPTALQKMALRAADGGMPRRELAKLLGMSRKTLKGYLSSARVSLRKAGIPTADSQTT